MTLAVQTSRGERWHELSARRCLDAVTGGDAILVSELDVSALKHTEAQAKFLAMHDPLTGLPNRAHVMQRFAAALADVGAYGRHAALLFMDLDHFKHVNDTLGHAAGDQLLVNIATRLRAVLRGSDLVARFGGDEFLILLNGTEIETEVEQLHQRLLASVAAPIRIGSSDLSITPSIGVSLYPRDGTDLDTLLRHADLAMYAAKARGRNSLAFYEDGMSVAARGRLALESELRQGLDRDEFELRYQPRVDVNTGRIVGAEALVRWRHPQRGLVQPGEFIAACEESGLIQPLGLHVLDAAARQQARWFQAGHPLQVSVNLSPRQFADSQLVARIERVLHESGCDPSRIELEVTESLLLGNDDRPITTLQAIEQLGVSIALDDFGTGYSNLGYLQRFPIRTLKIDKSFIQGIDGNRQLAELIVAMCRLMKLQVVAEGVETAAQLEWVRERQIEQYQGYWFAEPLTVAEFDERLRQSISTQDD